MFYYLLNIRTHRKKEPRKQGSFPFIPISYLTLGILETIVEGKAKFEKWGNFDDVEIMYDWDGKTADFRPDLNDDAHNRSKGSAVKLYYRRDGRIFHDPEDCINRRIDLIYTVRRP